MDFSLIEQITYPFPSLRNHDLKLLPQVVLNAEEFERLQSFDARNNPFLSLSEANSRQYSQLFEGAELIAIMSSLDNEILKNQNLEFHSITKITPKCQQIYLEIPKVGELFLPV